MSQDYLINLEKKYNKYVIKQDGCWDWKGCKINGGYGSVRIGYPKIYAHRASWILTNGEIPKNMLVLHKCDNRSCTNPEHLFLGTTRDNVMDAVKKGRHPTIGKSGANNHMAKLTPEEVIDIREWVSKGFTGREIAERYGISASHVHTLAQRACWRTI